MDDKNESKNRIERNKIRVKAFFDSKLSIHINLLDGTWLNGDILEVNQTDFFLINERKRGRLPVFYMDIYDIDKLEPRNTKDFQDGNNEEI